MFSSISDSLIVQYLFKQIKKHAIDLLIMAVLVYGFAMLASTLLTGSLFGPTKDELKVITQTQAVTIDQLQASRDRQDALTSLGRITAQTSQKKLTELYDNRKIKDQTYQEVLQAGTEAFKEASKAAKSPKASTGSQTLIKRDQRPLNELPQVTIKSDTLQDPQSPVSLQLAKAQSTMVHASFALAS